MAGNFDNTNRGVLFKNVKGKDSHPDYKGSVNVDGVDYWFSGWIKVAGPNARDPGSKFLSVALEKKDDSHPKPSKPSSPKPQFDDLGDDIPFSQGEHATA